MSDQDSRPDGSKRWLGEKNVDVEDVKSRFWEKVEMGKWDECWEWDGGKTPCGYGVLNIGDRNHGTHRISYRLHWGEIGNGHVLHKCGNPPCVNPNHLKIGTHAENMAEADHAKGESHHASKLTEDIVREIRERYPDDGQYVLADEFGVTHTTIGQVLRGETWTHVD